MGLDRSLRDRLGMGLMNLSSSGKTHLVVQFIGKVVAKTHCGRYIDAEWVTGKMEEVTCLRCSKGVKL